MTAFARKQIKGDWGTAVWEIRSVNQRYLETYFRLPEQFRGLEVKLKDLLSIENQSVKTIKMLNPKIQFQTPIYRVNNVEVWGATAMILSEFLEIIKKM